MDDDKPGVCVTDTQGISVLFVPFFSTCMTNKSIGKFGACKSRNESKSDTCGQ